MSRFSGMRRGYPGRPAAGDAIPRLARVTDPATHHLRPSAPLAERVLLPGDPHRALHVAQALLDQPKMFNHNRGLWGYTGTARDGAPLTVQATGMGGPSAAIVVEELIELGARALVRIGTCGALRPGFAIGELVAVEAVIGADGTSAALGAARRQRPDGGLTAALVAGGARPVTALTTDLFYDPREDAPTAWLAEGADVVEMEAAALLAVAARHRVAAAAVLAVTDLLAGGERERVAHAELEPLGVTLGEAGWAALADPLARGG
jgi:uridine phosphorylase